jgi:hypothetical protein
MKRNNLTTAILAGITGVAGIASVSHAVNLNSDGIGQVLVYPYYTVNNGNNTLISVVNTTNEVKAVKVRFLEGKNSRECLDFNLYLSPFDVWTAGLVATASTVPAVAGVAPFAGQESVKLLTSDTSCTVPAINNQEFLPYAFITSGTITANDGLGNDLVRCTEGHFEMIEMGTVTGTSAANATHTAAGVPASCAGINANWLPAGIWTANANTADFTAPDGSGGLFGSASIINVDNGTDVTYNADAIQNYGLAAQHSTPGNLAPNLKTGSELTSSVFNVGAGAGVQTNAWNDSVEAVSASYMHDHVYGEYVLSDSIGANTEWVVTFPTKFAYVDTIGAAGTSWGAAGIPQAPFTRAIGANGACEEYQVEGYWDREEQVPSVAATQLVPSPLPPGVNPNIPVFCWETNVLEFNTAADTLGNSKILGSNNTTHLTVEFDTGWASLNFDVTDSISGTNDHVATAADGTPSTYVGLPVTGFAVQRYTNANLSGGVLANYAGIFAHRYSKNITP